MRVAWLVFVALIAFGAGTARAGDPLRDYETIDCPHFVIHYWAGYDDVAHRVCVVAEHAHRTLSPALDHQPTEKTIIVLVDDTDSANGFAGVLPRNAIQLNLTGPSSITELDDHEDWLYALVAHEYSHILHLDTMSGLPIIYNHIFGKTWAPNQVMPRWIIEGIATYEESKRSAGGRNRGTRFDQVIRIARHAGKDLRLDQVGGSPRQFPRGNAAYIYGSHFLRYIFDRFGDDTLRAMSHASGDYPIPFAINRQIAKATGKPFTELFDDWKSYLRDRYALQEQGVERRGLRVGTKLTHTAEGNGTPQYSLDGKELYWQQSTGYDHVMVRAMPTTGTPAERIAAAREVVHLDNMGPYQLLDDGSLVYESGILYRREYTWQDLYKWDPKTHAEIRITRGARSRDPAVSPDNRRVAFSMNGKSESGIGMAALVPEAPIETLWKGQRYDQAYQPAWSPDGTRVAFSAWRDGGYRDILVVDVATRAVDEITHDRAIDMSPAWSPDGRYIYFDSDRSGIQNIFAFDTRDRSLWQITNTEGGAFQGRPSPDGKRLAYQDAVADGGSDLYEIDLDRANWLPARDFFDAKPQPVVIHDDEVAVTAPRPYRAVETLAPQTWTGQLDTSGGDHVASLQTGGADALGLHSYSLGLSSDLEKGTTNIGASYGYSGFRPGLRVAGSRTLVTRGGVKIDGKNAVFDEEDWGGTLALSVPYESRPGTVWTFSGDYDVDWYRSVGGLSLGTVPEDPGMREPLIPATNYVQAGVGTRVAFSNVHTTTYGIGGQEGFDLSVSLRLDHPDLGATYHNVTASYAFDWYKPLWSREDGTVGMLAPGTIALRGVGAVRAGDLIRGGGFGLGGVPAQDIVSSIVNSTRSSPIGYLHGFKPRSLTGNQYHLVNFEYRQEFVQIEHGLATLPFYVRRLTAAVQSDWATAFDTEFDIHNSVRGSVGGALRLDAYFGNYVPGSFEVGYSHGVVGAGAINETWLLLGGSL